ncbi:low affinity Fe/Cu permease [Aquabacter spiritensis]|uniref:Low affinity Fe/Cu permease n=1 Tax=Aquabacter spiritensis TaxID=933073 RepID=A0A4V2UYL0_9HYPH|nr:low affinity Fe/Cu permease [Aquabacter spiritensis]
MPRAQGSGGRPPRVQTLRAAPAGPQGPQVRESGAATPAAASPAPVATGPAPRPFFTRLSQAFARFAGKPATFVGAAGMIVLWGATGPLFGFNDTWQLVINTSTTIVTFLMVFLIQNSQNRDTAALQIKLDELIARTEGPRNVLLDLEDLDEETLDRLRADYARLADLARAEAGEGAEVVRPDRSFRDVCDPARSIGEGARGTAKPAAQPVAGATANAAGAAPASQRAIIDS